MPKSKINKERKTNLNNFKNQQKSKFMSENQTTTNAPQMTPFRQVPVWNQDATFEINGNEFMVLQNFFNIFAEPIAVVQEIFKRGLNAGTIQTKYIDEKGEEVSKEQIEAYMKQMQEFFKNSANAPIEGEKNETPKVKEPTLKKTRTVGKSVKQD